MEIDQRNNDSGEGRILFKKRKFKNCYKW
jgi:hypothetical protein